MGIKVNPLAPYTYCNISKSISIECSALCAESSVIKGTEQKDRIASILFLSVLVMPKGVLKSLDVKIN